jgi:hypothetical protein
MGEVARAGALGLPAADRSSRRAAFFLLVGFLWSLVVPGGGLPSRDTAFRAAVWSLLLFPIIIPVHELIHALAHPNWGRSAQSSLGLWPRTLLFYAHYSGEWPRRRFVACLLAPFVALSICPLVWAWIFGAKHGLAVVVSLLNTLLSCGDLAGALMVVVQVPREAIVRNQGYYTWWRY